MTMTTPSIPPFAIWDPETMRWETGQLMLGGHSESFSETWPISGTTRNGSAFERPTWAHVMAGGGPSSTHVFPTPRATRGGSATETMYVLGAERTDEGRPQGEVLLKTPTSQLAVNGGSQHPDKRRSGGHGPTLADEVEHLLGTPHAAAGMQSPMRRGVEDAHGRLEDQVSQLCPTPTAKDAARSGGSGPSDITLTDAMCKGKVLPTPTAADGDRRSAAYGNGNPTLEGALLLPTPTANDSGNVEGKSQFARNTVPLSHALLPTPRATDGTKGGPNQRGSSGDLMLPSAVVHLLPTPNPFHMGNQETPDEWLERRKDVEERTGTRHGPALPVVAISVTDGAPLVQDGNGPHTEPAAAGMPFGPYEAAIRRHERVIGRTSPSATVPTGKGERLNCRFVEWMMMLPEGHVTDTEGVTANKALGALGNGVVPPQGAAALRLLIARFEGETA